MRLEAACYADLTALVREAASGGEGAHRLVAAAPAGGRGVVAGRRGSRHRPLRRTPSGRQALDRRCSTRTRVIWPPAQRRPRCCNLLAQNPAEKKLVFVHHRDSLTHLADRLRRQKMPLAIFTGRYDRSARRTRRWRRSATACRSCCCTESGGEGRNLQFCNTLINFDIPWNPMAIEQRIGRIDRIGQTREVFIFNLVTAGTIEDSVLRILDEKINMFELVVGEVGAILGEIDEQQDFSTLVLDAWLQGTEQARAEAFAKLEGQLLAARRDYEGVKQLDEALFGNELDAA